jgi:site-specific recombinase XerD
MSCLVRDKRGIFHVVTYVKGKHVWQSTRTRKRAEAFKVLAQIETSPSPGQAERGIGKYVQEYLAHVKANFSPKTHEIYRIALNHLIDFTGNMQVDELNTHLIDQYKVHRLPSVTPTTVNVETRAIRTFFNCLKRWEVIAKNPCDGVHQIRIAEELPTYFAEKELARLIDGLKDEWLRRIVLFAAMTGARRGEILNLTWDDVNLKDRLVTIHSSSNYRVKGGKVRVVPLNETVARLLESMPDKKGLVFKGIRGEKANGNHVGCRFRSAVRELGFDRKLHFHSLRHSFASLLVQKGVSLYHVQKLLGHSSARVTEVYAHLQNAKMHDIVAEIDISPTKPVAKPVTGERSDERKSRFEVIQMSIEKCQSGSQGKVLNLNRRPFQITPPSLDSAIDRN